MPGRANHIVAFACACSHLNTCISSWLAGNDVAISHEYPCWGFVVFGQVTGGRLTRLDPVGADPKLFVATVEISADAHLVIVTVPAGRVKDAAANENAVSWGLIVTVLHQPDCLALKEDPGECPHLQPL